jgi:hypothetical protein
MMTKDHINPDAKPKGGSFYYASDALYDDGAVIRKGTDDTDACLYATESIDECMVLDGFGHIYLVHGISCRHYWAPDVSYSIQSVYGGYYTGIKNHTDFPPTAHQFDEQRLPTLSPAAGVGMFWVQLLISLVGHTPGIVCVPFEGAAREFAQYHQTQRS